MQHLPAVGGEALFGVVAARQIGAAVDRDAVVVEEADQLAQLEVTGVAGRFVRDAFHEAAVAGHEVRVVIDDVMTRAVERRGQMRLGHGETDRVGDALSERAGGRFHARRVMHLGVPRREALPLPEPLDLGQRQVVPRHVQRAVQQHRGMAHRQHEAVAVGPQRRRRVVPQVPCVQRVCQRSERHRGARVAGLGRLYGIHGEGADRIDRETFGLGEGNGRHSGHGQRSGSSVRAGAPVEWAPEPRNLADPERVDLPTSATHQPTR